MAILDDDLNNTSIVMRLSFTDPGAGVSFLFTGDAEAFVEQSLIQSHGDALRSTVLKVGHHGSTSSSTLGFLRVVRPEHAVICSGNQKFSGTMLPREETLIRNKIIESPDAVIENLDAAELTAPTGLSVELIGRAMYALGQLCNF